MSFIDGKHTAIEFRNTFLKTLDSEDAWKSANLEIVLDFEGVTKIGPSFANESLAYFTKFAKPKEILKKIKLANISKVKKAIIEIGLKSGYTKVSV